MPSFLLLLLLAAPAPRHGMAVAVSPPGADVGREILLAGGNAVDAAVAMGFAMAVTYPSAGNLGGGGFMVVHPAKGPPMVVEYREKAPLAAKRAMFTKKDSVYSHKAAGVPGTVAGLWLAHKTYGKLPWRDVVAPAVRLAGGFRIDASLAGSLNWATNGSQPTPEMRRVLGKKDDWSQGDRLAQPDLKATLRRIQDRGPDGFYLGKTAELIVKEMRSGDGLITLQDLKAYKANLRKPVHATYRGHDVYAPPPPSSGGICLAEMLNVLENFDLKKDGRFSGITLHRMAEAMKRAYCDRARHLGDGDFVKIPAHLTSKAYARKLAASIGDRATPSASLASDIEMGREGDSTTHFSVIDGDGMAVANTYTLERSYGSRIVVRGAGFLLNNEMMDFNWFPGETNQDGTHRHRAEHHPARQAHALLADADHRGQERQGAVGHRQPRQPHHHQHVAQHGGQRRRFRDDGPAGRGRAPAASPMVPRRAAFRGRPGASPGRGIPAQARPCRGRREPGRRPHHPRRSQDGRIRRRGRQAHQREGFGVLNASCTMASEPGPRRSSTLAWPPSSCRTLSGILAWPSQRNA